MKRGCLRWAWAPPSAVVLLLLGCSSDTGPSAGSPLPSDTGGVRLDGETAGVPCQDPTSTDCPCDAEGTVLECGELREVRGDYAICSMGVRRCDGGAWSACMARSVVETQAADPYQTPSGLRLQALASGTDCLNLCDPRCIKHVDSPAALSVSEDLDADDDGLTLPALGSGGNCANILVAPATATINITNIAASGAITTSPPNATATFSATCASGAPIQPSWSIDAYDRAIIDANGKVTPFSGIGSPILVTAASAQDTTTALLNVNVNMVVNGSAAATLISDFAGAGSSTDTARTQYPYQNTIFPLDLKAPLVQYDTGGNNATEVQVALRFPAGASSPTFWYSKIYTSGDPKEGPIATGAPAWQIPQEIWSALDRSAAGSASDAEILIQRRYGGSVRPERSIRFKFASEAIPGTVYYTQYRREFADVCPTAKQDCTFKQSGSYTIGQVCEVGYQYTKPASSATYPTTLRAIDLAQRTAPNKDPFGSNTSATKCPVCHSISANGNVFVSDSQGWSQSGSLPQPVPGRGINTIGVTTSGDPLFTQLGEAIAPTYTGLSDTGASNAAGDPFNNHERTGENSRGFAYGAITPDGALVLQGATFWGNTQDTPASGTQNATLLGLTGKRKPYFAARTADPGVGVQFATTAALGSHTWSPGVISGSSGKLTVDGYTLTSVDQAVLVKDESTRSHNGIYRLSNVDPWKLERRYDADASSELTSGMEVRVSDGNLNRGRVYYITTTGTITPNTTEIAFADRTLSVSFGSAPLEVSFATSGPLPGNTQNSSAPFTLTGTAPFAALKVDGITMTVGRTVLVKDESSSSKNGVYSVSVVGNGSTAWRLTRTNDTLTPGQEIKATGGTTNLNKVFALSSPASGAIALTTDPNTPTEYELQTLPTMMVPVISPDGSRIAYVNGDSDRTPGLTDTGWRRGLSLLTFEQDTLTVSNKVRLLNTWPSTGNNFKWPFFESDSRSLVYVETPSSEHCSAADSDRNLALVSTDLQRACFDNAYGNMAPTARGYWSGKLFSLNTAASNPSSTRAELRKLNEGDDDGGTDDGWNAGRSYQPTVLPFSKGGYRWVIFTSTRAYGNQLNQASGTAAGSTPTHFTCASPNLWMAALDDTSATSADRSHPAFLVPGQNMAAITDATQPHFLNERGYLVPTPCKSTGVSCTSNTDCCGGSGSNPTAACRAPTTWTPASGPPAKTCAAVGGTCSLQGQSCNTPADCCNGAACVNFLCAAPPTYEGATYDRTYEANCPDSYQPTWQLLSYYLTTGSDSRLDFSVQTGHDLVALDAAPVLSVGSSTADVVSGAATPDFLTPTPDYQDVGNVLKLANAQGQNFLRVIIDFVPSTDELTAPILHDWEMRYTCDAAQ